MMNTKINYDILNEGQPVKIEMEKRSDLRKIYFEFLRDFRGYLVEFVKDSVGDVAISEIIISEVPTVLFNEIMVGRYVILKNQGDIACYMTTTGSGGFRLDPGEKEKIYVTKSIAIATPKGKTTLGIIQT